MRIVFPDLNPYLGGSCRPARGAFKPPGGGKVNSTDIAEWLVSPGVRYSYSQDGAVLVDLRHGHYYKLNGVATRVWATVETSPSGITAENIVDVLQTHFKAPREELEREAEQCLADLQRAGLVRDRVAASDASCVDRIARSPQGGARVRESGQEEVQIMLYEQHFVQRFETVESLAGQLHEQGLEREIDWRAKKLKDFIDNAPGKIHGSLRDICEQLRLSLSERQARRLFKDSTGISIREYARKRRLVLAAKRLQDTDEPIKVVATDAGYRTHQAFKNSFYGMFGLTPMEFRKIWHRSQVTA
jgi:AraC-like DNA-binding protein